MDPRKWLPDLPLFSSVACVYCGAPADTIDHTPPKCLLPKPLLANVQIMTVPACSACNKRFQRNEMYTAAVVGTVSFTQADKIAVAPGGRLHSAMQRDAALRDFIGSRLGVDGVFIPDRAVLESLSQVSRKTAAGLLFHEFGRIVPIDEISFVRVEHARNVNPSAFVENHRRMDFGFAEVTPSGRELERQVVSLLGGDPPHPPRWREYIPEFFEYLFLRRSNRTLLTAIKLHDALTILLECPWPSSAGPKRKGKSPKRSS